VLSLSENRTVHFRTLRTNKMTDDLYTVEKLKHDFEVPKVFMPLVMDHPRLLPGESKDSFFALFDIMVGVISPNEDLEWLTTIDLTWLQFDIQRYRRWKSLIIMANRGAALEAALSTSHPGAVLVGGSATISAESKMQAQEIGRNPDAHPNVRSRLESYGYDADTINAGAFTQSIVPLVTLEKLLSSARRQVAMLLREVELTREFKRRASMAVKQIEQDPVTTDQVQVALK
jgi:hypothetical protein